MQLTDDELLTMYRWAQAEYGILRSGISKKEVREYFRKLDRQSFSCVMSFLVFKMFGKHEWGGQTIFDLLPEFKRKLAESVYVNQGGQKDAVSQKQEPSSCQGEESPPSNQEIKRDILTALTEKELAVLYVWMREKYRPGLIELEMVRDIRDALNDIGAKYIFCFTHYILFGTHPTGTANAKQCLPEIGKKVLCAISVLKEKLSASPHAKKLDESERCSALIRAAGTSLSSGDMKACNPNTGEVEITEHALTRFKERYSGKDSTPQQLLKRFRQLFQGAVPTDLSPEHRVARIIEHGFQKARYFLNTGANLRFVVLEDKSIIVTVERPR